MSSQVPEPLSFSAPPAIREDAQASQAPTGPTAGERMLAALAHLLMMLSVPGLLLAAVIWLTQRKRSPYVASQARAAVIWQIVGNVITILLIVALLIAAIVSLGGAIETPKGGDWLAGLFSSLFGLYVVLFATVALFFLTALVGAWRALRGRPAHIFFTRRHA